MSDIAPLRVTEPSTRPLDPSIVTMQQRELQPWVYKPLRAGPWTIAILIFTLIVLLGVTFSCTLAFFPTQRSLPVPWATLVAFANTLLALLGLLGTLRWWHYARPRLPKLPIHENASCADVSDVDLQGTLEHSAADTPAKIGFIVTWISYQIVRVADLVFGHRMPPHLIFNSPFGGSCVDQESGCDVSVLETRPQEESGKDQHEPARSAIATTEGPSGSAHQDQYSYQSVSQLSTTSSPVNYRNDQRGRGNQDARPTTHSRPDRGARKDWDEQRRHNDGNRVPLNRQQGTMRRHLAELRRLALLDRSRFAHRPLGGRDQMH